MLVADKFYHKRTVKSLQPDDSNYKITQTHPLNTPLAIKKLKLNEKISSKNNCFKFIQ